MSRRSKLHAIAAATLACSAVFAQQDPWPRYRIERISVTNFTPVALNNVGQACGYQRYVWDGGPPWYVRPVVRDLDATIRVSPDFADELPLNIDDHGMMYGVGLGSACYGPSPVYGCWNRLPRWHAVKFDPLLRVVTIRTGFGFNINTQFPIYHEMITEVDGVGAGNQTDNYGRSGWLRNPNGTFVSAGGAIADMNRRRNVLRTDGSVLRADGTNTFPRTLPGVCTSEARDLNNVDGILLWGSCGNTRRAGLLLPDGSIVPVAELPGGGEAVETKRINDSFMVVGSDSETLCPTCSDTQTSALIFHPALGSRSVTSLVNGLNAGERITNAVDINNWGMILATTNGINCVLIPDVPCATVVAQPRPSCTTVGQPVTLAAAFASPTPLTFQWHRDGIALVDGDGLSGARLPSLTIDAMAVRHVGAYTCTATATCGSVMTVAAALRLPSTLTVVQQPQSQAVASTGSVTFSVDAVRNNACSSPLEYAWQRRDLRITDENAPGAWVDLSDGGGFVNTRTQALTLLQALPGMAGPYRCRVTDPCGCDPVFSEPADFSVACPSDFNGDGGVDFGDVEAFFERWENGC